MLQWNPDARASCSQVLEDLRLATSAGTSSLASSQGDVTHDKDALLQGDTADNMAGAPKEQQTTLGSESARAADGREEAPE
eukprot:12785883-Alexandrium_andersonii.AAC.1